MLSVTQSNQSEHVVTPSARRAPTGAGDSGLQPRTATALAYLAGPFSGALLLFLERRNHDVRFHAWQSVLGLGGLGAAVVLAYVLGFASLFVTATAVSVMVGMASVLWLLLLAVWAFCLYKAATDGRFHLPLVGDYAERFA